MSDQMADETAQAAKRPDEIERRAIFDWILRAAIGLMFLALIVWSFAGMTFDWQSMRKGFHQNKYILAQMWPHGRADLHSDWHYLIALGTPIASTIQMAVVGTVIAAVPAFPICFLAARTTSLFRPLSNVMKTGLNIGRGVPTIVYALLVVGFVGLGPQAGAVAISIASFFMLAKLYAEALESVSPGPIEAVRAAGGDPAQVFVFGMLPQVFPNFLSATLYALELNLQASFIVGLVGAGGLGYELQQDIGYLKWLYVGLLIVLLAILVNLVDYLSYQLRKVFA